MNSQLQLDPSAHPQREDVLQRQVYALRHQQVVVMLSVLEACLLPSGHLASDQEVAEAASASMRPAVEAHACLLPH